MTQKTDATAIFNDRRQHARVGLNYKVLFHVLDERAAIEEVGAMEAKNKALAQEPVSSDALDLSLGGIGIQGSISSLREPLYKDGLLSLELRLPGHSVRCVGSIAWVRKSAPDQFTAGIAFVEMDKEALASVEAAVAEALANSKIDSV
jgi:hypothetical protein